MELQAFTASSILSSNAACSCSQFCTKTFNRMAGTHLPEEMVSYPWRLEHKSFTLVFTLTELWNMQLKKII